MSAPTALRLAIQLSHVAANAGFRATLKGIDGITKIQGGLEQIVAGLTDLSQLLKELGTGAGQVKEIAREALVSLVQEQQ